MKYFDFFFIKSNLLQKGQILFLIALFFLPSTLLIGIIFLIPAAIIGSKLNKKNYFEDKINIGFFTCGLFITVSALLQKFVLVNQYSEIWDSNLTLIGLANWIPFFWIFWAIQPYLESKKQRERTAKIIIFGTFPVLVSGFGQYFFNWTGPWEILNGLIIWYQKPIENPAGLSGLFSNQNYAGSWLNFVWPFSIALTLTRSKNLIRKIFTINFLAAIGFATFLTNSRNAWSGLLFAVPIVIGYESFIWLVPLLVIVFFLIMICTAKFLNGDFQDYVRSLIPDKIWLEFSEEGFKEIDVSRIEIFLSALMLIIKNPLFGIGAASFPAIYYLQTSFWKGHSHNLILEFTISYGVPSTIILLSTIIAIMFVSGNSIFLNSANKNLNYFDRAWWSAAFFFMISQLVDIQYFDGKIAILYWILMAGLRNLSFKKENCEKYI